MQLIFFMGAYLLFFGLLFQTKRRGANRIITKDGRLVSSPLLLWLHLAGVVLFGVLPLFYLGWNPTLFSTQNWRPVPTLVSVFLFLFTLSLAPKLAQKQQSGFSPDAGVAPPTLLFLGLYFLLRLFFIVAYEIWFRGLLLQETVAALGTPWAIVLNTGLYTLLHLVNEKQEWLLCMPFGILLCSLCIWQQAVWPAVFIHLALTLGYELTLVKKHVFNTRSYADSRHWRFGLYRS